MTANYLEETILRLVAIEKEINVLVGESASAQPYGQSVRDQLFNWRNILGETRVTSQESGSQLRTHTIYAVWTIGNVGTGEEGDIELRAQTWLVTVLDYLQARPDLHSAAYVKYPPWMYEEGAYVSNATGVIWSQPSTDGKRTASITFTIIAPFRVRAQRS